MRWLHFRLPMLITAGTAVGSIMDSRRRTWNMSTGSWAQLVAVLGPIIPLETPVGFLVKTPHMIPNDTNTSHHWPTQCTRRHVFPGSASLNFIYCIPHLANKQNAIQCALQVTDKMQNGEKKWDWYTPTTTTELDWYSILGGWYWYQFYSEFLFFCKDPLNICNRARIFYSLPTNLTIYNWLKQLTLL